MPYVFPSEEMVLIQPAKCCVMAAAEAMVNRAARTARRNEEWIPHSSGSGTDAQNHSVHEIAETDNIQSLALSDQRWKISSGIRNSRA